MTASKTVRMVGRISGTRDGRDWPAPGETITLPEDEALRLVAAGMATTLKPTENALAPTAGTETATVPGNQSLRSTVRAEEEAAAAEADAKAKAAAEAEAKATADAAAAKIAADAKAAKVKVTDK